MTPLPSSGLSATRFRRTGGQFSPSNWTLCSLTVVVSVFFHTPFSFWGTGGLNSGPGQPLELVSLDINQLTFEAIPNDAKSITSLPHIGIHENELFFFEV